MRKTSAQLLQELYERTAVSGFIPPQCIEVEQSVLGAMMISPEAASKIIAVLGTITLETTPFYRESHSMIYMALVKLDAKSIQLDLLSATEELRKMKFLDAAGGPAYLAELASKVVTTANVANHARLILEKHLQRQVIIAGEWMKLKAYEGRDDTFNLIDSIGSRLYEIGSVRYKRGVHTLGSINHGVIASAEAIEKRVNESGHYVTGVASGLSMIDDLTTGWQKTDLIILAARPSQGKTAHALHYARCAALGDAQRPPVPTAIFSLEMGEEQLALRLLCSQAQVNMQKVRKGMVSAIEWKRISQALVDLSEAPIYIDDTSGITPSELRAKARRLKQDHDIGLIIVDYIQLMEPDHRQDSREREISSISRALKGLAKELNVPVIALSQLNRSLENRAEKKPMLSDLRESGAIEQDADIVMFIYRPATYGQKNFDNGMSADDAAEIIIAKQRNGPIGSAYVNFYADTGTYSDMKHDPDAVFSEEAEVF